MHVMVDLETMGLTPQAAVASIGAVAFDPHVVNIPEHLTDRFYVRLDMRGQVGRSFEPDTIYWWMHQSEDARRQMSANPMATNQALLSFGNWIKAQNPSLVWAFGANFDHPILTSLFAHYRLEYPVPYNRQACARTIAKISTAPCPDYGTAHSAIDDAVRQAVWVQRCYAALGVQ